MHHERPHRGHKFLHNAPSAQNSLLFSLSLEGNIPHNLTDSEVPIEMSIHLLPEFSSLRPIIQTVPAQLEQAQIRREDEVRPRPMGVIAVPFLPLTPNFNKTSTEAWSTLASKIQQWLIFCIRDQELPHWKWGVEVFWVAFVAAFPSFPLGDWPLWDSRIPMAGQFIESKLVANDFEETTQKTVELTGEDLVKRREELWEEFCTIVQFLYPYPIQAVEVAGQV
ncbi:hypothetical protein EI94DRAFT_1762787 [Lactarius quietus]|nr:hypothetical protein EI94DRAFT_1762787 [Lactarius quietus]